MKSALVHILGSTAVSQMLLVASTPLLTRLYSQSEFGVLGIATTAAVIGAALLSMKLEQSLHASTLSAQKVFNTALYLVAILGALLLLPLATLASLLVPKYALTCFLIVLFAIGLCCTTITLLKLNFQQRFSRLAVLSLLVPAIFIGGAVFSAEVTTNDSSINFLLLWQAVAYAFGGALGLFFTRKSLTKQTLSDLKMVIATEKDNLIYLVPSTICNFLTLNMAIIGAVFLYSEAAAGLVVLAQRIARLPVSMVGNALNEVLRSTIPKRINVIKTLRWIIATSITIAVAMVICIYSLPESAYTWIFGNGWPGLKSVLLITAVGAGFQLVGTSVVSMLTVLRKKSDLMVNAGLLLVSLFAITIALIFKLDLWFYLWAHVILGAAIYLTGLILAWREAQKLHDSLPIRSRQ